MKLKYLFIALASSLCLFASCEKEEATSLDSIKLDKTYLSIPAGGGSATLTIDAKEAWSFAKDIVLGKDDNKNNIYGQLPAWLKASTLSGGAGKATVTFSADPIDGGREQEMHILVGDGETKTTQYIIVRQGSLEAVKASCAEVLAGADGKTFTTTGTCTSIANTNYGNWYLNDGTGEVYIYGTVDATGSYNWASFGIEVGDVVTVQGPKTTYNGTVELVDVSVIKVVKSLLKIDKDAVVADKAGDEFTVTAAYKGNGVFVNPSADWVVLSGMKYIKGQASKTEPNPADTAVVKFKVQPNLDAARNCKVEFSSGTSTVTLTVDQAGLDLTVSELLAAEKGALVTTKASTVVAKTTKGFVISDGAKAVYVYDSGANAVALGDNVVVKGSKTVYNGVHEVEKVSEVKVESSGNKVNYPAARAVTPEALTYKADEAEYITLYGKLAVSGNYLNVNLEGIDNKVKQGSIVSPVDDLNAKSFDGKDIVITGYFNGLSGSNKYINVIATSIKEYTPGSKGTYANPYLASEIAALLGGGTKFADPVFVKGKVSKVASQYSAQYGNAQFWISDDGAFKNDPTKDFEAYNALYFGAKNWVEGNGTVKEGDEVMLYGLVTYYAKNKVAETSGKQAYLFSLNGKTE